MIVVTSEPIGDIVPSRGVRRRGTHSITDFSTVVGNNHLTAYRLRGDPSRLGGSWDLMSIALRTPDLSHRDQVAVVNGATFELFDVGSAL